jgi:DNA modification methylase
MPELNWHGKKVSNPTPIKLVTDSLVYPQGIGYPKVRPENRLIQAENLSAMAALLPQYEGGINLIYADPPFFTNKKFTTRIGRGEDSRKPKEWKLAEGYHDNWENLDSYLDFLYQRLTLIHRLLASDGTLYLHLDWHADSYARLLLDEIFGADHLLNQIVWAYHGPSPITSAFNRKHDIILSYVKGEKYTFNADAVREPYHQNTVNTFKSSKKAGFGKIPNLARGKVPEDWWYFPVVARLHNERTGYPTQKPEALLERIILASSNKGDTVADFFCGSGTLPVVAARHERKFIACDESFRSVHTTRKRLVSQMAFFSVEHDSRVVWEPLSVPRSTKIWIKDQSVVLDTKLNLDYWEMDPEWDGITFKSFVQAVRPLRNGELPRELKIKTGLTGCVRLVTAVGKQYQLHV